MEHVAAADRIASDQGDDDLGHRTNEALEVEDVESGHAVRADIAAPLVAADFLVAARAERELTVGLGVGAAEEHHADAGVIAGIGEGLEHFGDGVGRERVAPVRAVDGHAGDSGGLFVDDVLEVPASFPLDFGRHGHNLQERPAISND